MAIDNPDLSLKNLNELESKIISNLATVKDYEELDFLISAIGGNEDYIKNSLIQNGVGEFSEYIIQRSENAEGTKIRLAKIYGTILGALEFLKSYAIQHKFYL